MRRIVSAVVVVLCAVGALGGCGGGGNDEDVDTVTGRVVSLRDDTYCVSPDRGATETCVDIPDPLAVEGVDVGECVTTSRDLTAEGAKVEVVDEAACAAGDLGEDADDGG